jgi:hypothetical protein
MDVHAELEEAVARFKGTQGALVFGAGYLANLGILSTLGGPEAVVFSDELNHASLIDGCRLSRSRIEVFRHRDVSHLEDLLRRVRAKRRIVVTDGQPVAIEMSPNLPKRLDNDRGSGVSFDANESVFSGGLEVRLDPDAPNVRRSAP